MNALLPFVVSTPDTYDRMIPRMVILAESSIAGVIFWSIVALVLMIAGMAFALRLKKRLKAEDEVPDPPTGFTLSDLRQMHRTGQLSDEEFERAKQMVVVAAQKVEQRKPDPATPVERDSVDAIRARRMAREAQGGISPPPQPPDGSAGV